MCNLSLTQQSVSKISILMLKLVYFSTQNVLKNARLSITVLPPDRAICFAILCVYGSTVESILCMIFVFIFPSF